VLGGTELRKGLQALLMYCENSLSYKKDVQPKFIQQPSPFTDDTPVKWQKVYSNAPTPVQDNRVPRPNALNPIA
jgi:hypothetical protein